MAEQDIIYKPTILDNIFGGIRRFVLFALTILVIWAVLTDIKIPENVFTLIGMVYAFYFGADFLAQQQREQASEKKAREEMNVKIRETLEKQQAAFERLAVHASKKC